MGIIKPEILKKFLISNPVSFLEININDLIN